MNVWPHVNLFQTADVASHSRGAMRPSFARNSLPSKQRAQGRPGARCTRGPVCDSTNKNCTRAYRAAVNTRPSLRNGFTAYNVLSPENGSFASVAPRKLLPKGALTPAPRRRDHTSLPYASVALVGRNISVHRNPSNVRDDGRRPSE
jgi:hypothetical protein